MTFIWNILTCLLVISTEIYGHNSLLNHRMKRQTKFEFEDCGSKNRLIKFLDVFLKPTPVLAPGNISVSYLFNVTETLPETILINVYIYKYITWVPILVPCLPVGNAYFGSCTYNDICDSLDQTFDPCNCPDALVRHNLPCTCPLTKGEYALPSITMAIPEIKGSSLAKLILGEYEIKAQVIDFKSKKEIGCLKLKGVEIKRKQKCKGWFCRRRRSIRDAFKLQQK